MDDEAKALLSRGVSLSVGQGTIEGYEKKIESFEAATGKHTPNSLLEKEAFVRFASDYVFAQHLAGSTMESLRCALLKRMIRNGAEEPLWPQQQDILAFTKGLRSQGGDE